MPSFRYLALLRGINVGGNNLFAKDDLRRCFENLGFTSVRTYIQSGNILFRADTSGVRELTARVEEALSRQFQYDAQAVVLSHRQYKSALAAAHDHWGQDAQRKHNALFPVGRLTSSRVLAQLPEPKSDIETITTGPGVLFWSIDKQQQSRTTYARLAANPLYKQLTIRNHNTTKKLLELFAEI
ncbi:DUF1697 domain-containing protein [Aeoliella sp.]|uniref:DUF1697 domain-containing protein n=1 Tax=Aeoliella sp. TaxID=2795800 RepID=UPI003CCB93DD